MHNNTFANFERDMSELMERFDRIVAEAQSQPSAQARADQLQIGKVVTSMAQRKVLAMMNRLLEMGEEWSGRKDELAGLRAAEDARIRDERAAAIRAEVSPVPATAMPIHVTAQHGAFYYGIASDSVSSGRSEAVACLGTRSFHELLLSGSELAHRPPYSGHHATAVVSPCGHC